MATITHIHDCDIQRRAVPGAYEGDFRDCYIEGDVAGIPSGAHDGTQVAVGLIVPGAKGSEYERRGLIWYDLRAYIPRSAVITAARWWFYVVSTNATNDHNFRLQRIRRNDEASGNHWKEGQASWTNYRTGQAWGVPGAADTTTDRDTAISVTLGAITTTGWKNYDILALASDAWANRGGICTFIMERSDAYMTVQGEVMFHAKNYEVDPYGGPLAHHLRITYTLDGRTFQALVFDGIGAPPAGFPYSQAVIA